MSTAKKRYQKFSRKEKGSKMWSHGHCKVCGNMLDDHTQEFCSEACRLEFDYQQRKKRQRKILTYGFYVVYLIVAIILVLFTSGFIVLPI